MSERADLRRENVVAVEPRDLLDDFRLGDDVGAPRGWRYAHDRIVVAVLHGEADRRQKTFALGRFDRLTKHPLHTGGSNRNSHGRRNIFVHVCRRPLSCTTCNGNDEIDGEGEMPGQRRYVDAALVAIARVRGKPKLSSCRTHPAGIEHCHFKQDVCRGASYFTSLSADHAGNRLRALCAGNHRHLIVQCSLDSVQCFDLFARMRAAHSDSTAIEPRQIERMHRLAETMKHVIRGVDDVVDGTPAHRFDSR